MARAKGAPDATGAPGAEDAPDALRVGSSQVSDVQRARMLRAAVEVVGERGYAGMSVARVTARAGVSRRTFYDLFEDREDCFLAAFEDCVAQAVGVAREAAAEGDSWREQVRSGLAALLALCDEDPLLGSLLVVDALAAGPRALAARARTLAQLIAIVERGREQVKAGREPPALTAEGVVGAVLAVVHARLQEPVRRPLLDLLGELMGMIVLPYLGQGGAAEELTRDAPELARRPRKRERDPLAGLDLRLTYRTLRVLTAVAVQPRASNRVVADAAGVHDQGQISKLLARLETLGLIENTSRGRPRGEPNAWALTGRGRAVERSVRLHGKASS